MSTLHQDIQYRKQKIIEDYYFKVKETEKYWIRDNKAAVIIQKCWRMFRLRKAFLKKRSN